MTIQNWMTMALIIATLIAPTLGDVLKPRIGRPLPANEGNLPKNLTQRNSGWLRDFLTSPWYVPAFVILFNAYLLRGALQSAIPLTRQAVYNISFSAAGTLYGLILVIVYSHARAIRNQARTMHYLAQGFSQIVEFVGTLSRDLKATKSLALSQTLKDLQGLVSELEKAKHRIARKARSAPKPGSDH